MPHTITKNTASPDSGQSLLNTVATLQELGINIPKTLTSALEVLAERRRYILDTRAQVNPETAMRDAAAALAAGTGTLTDVLNGATAKTLLDKSGGTVFASIFDQALRMNSAAIQKELAALGDKWVTDILRPAVTEHMAVITSAYNSGMELDPIYSPDQVDYLLYTPGVSDAWGTLRRIHSSANHFRSYNIIPSQARETQEYEYLGEDPKLDHLKDTLTWFLWANQQGLKPGIYTEADKQQEAAA